MKRATTLLTTAAALLTFGASVAPAAQLASDAFNYPDGNLVGNATWNAHSAGGSLPIQVAGGQAVVAQGAGSREDANLLYAPQGNAATTYACFLVTVNAAAPVAVGTNDYFAHFRTSSNFNFRARIYVAGIAGGDFTFALSASSGGPTAFWATPLSFGTQYRVVSSYDAATGTVRLWVNPAGLGDTNISETLAAAAGEAVDSYALRQSSTYTLTQTIDNLVVSDQFDPCDRPTPASATTWGKLKGTYR